MSSAIPMRRPRKRLVVPVFNPTHFADEVAVGGHFFSFEPMSVGRCNCAHHQKEAGEDPTGVHELTDWPRNEKGVIVDSGGRGTREVVMTADQVADHIVSPDCRGDKGFVRLEGTEAEQEDQKRAAIEKWVKYHLADVEQEIATWEAHVSNLRAARPGDPPPRRPRRVVAAYQFRDNHLAMLGRRAKFVCDMCGWDGLEAIPPRADTAANLAEHRRVTHPGVVIGQAAVEAAPAPGKAEEDLGNAAGGSIDGAGTAPEGTAVATSKDKEGAAVAARAKAMGVELSVADKKGLAHDDPDVIGDVKARIDVAKAAAAANAKKKTSK